MASVILCSVSGCSNETVEEWVDQTMENVVENAESQGIHIDVLSNTGTESSDVDKEEIADNTAGKNKYAVGETVNMIADNSAEISITLTEWGKHYDSTTNEEFLYVSYSVENIGNEDITVGDGMFDVYADDYSVNQGYPLNVDSTDNLSVDLSAGRKMDSRFYAEINPDTVTNLEVECGDVIWVLKEPAKKAQAEDIPTDLAADAEDIDSVDLAGRYVGDYATFYMNMYTDIGGESVGYVGVTCTDNTTYAGEFVKIIPNVYQLMSNDGKQIIVGISRSQDGYKLDVYMDGIFIDSPIMVERYVS